MVTRSSRPTQPLLIAEEPEEHYDENAEAAAILGGCRK